MADFRTACPVTLENKTRIHDKRPGFVPCLLERIPMREIDLAVIGGGAAGMAAAVSARKNGVQNILILERNSSLGGVLQQCIHNGFGLHRFGEDLTGVEFAAKYADMVKELEIPYLLNTFVIELRPDKTIELCPASTITGVSPNEENEENACPLPGGYHVLTAISPEEGLLEIRAKAVVLAMGCRERSRNALLIPGARGAGIMTAGTAQRYLNIDGYLPGRRIVIVGSGDIGLIMARQFVLEGCEVAAVVEIMPYSGGLPRNMKQCIEDFDIPVYYNAVIAEVRGKERVSSVLVGKVDENRRLIPGTEFKIPCDTLLISAGLIPENELTESAGIAMSRATKGAEVTEDLQTSVPGIFSCGNVLHVHDLVDFVSEEGEEAGRNAAAYLHLPSQEKSTDSAKAEEISAESEETEAAETDPAKTEATETEAAEIAPSTIRVLSGSGVGGIVPQSVRRDTAIPKVSFMFRPRARWRDAVITARAVASGKGTSENSSSTLVQKRFLALTPGEMCKITISSEKLKDIQEIIFDIDGTSV